MFLAAALLASSLARAQSIEAVSLLPRLREPAFAVTAERSPDEVDAAIARRRFQFTLHQALGFTTEAVGLAALAVSIADDHDRFGSGGRTGQFKNWELGLSISTETLTVLNYTLAVTAPRPFDREPGLDTTVVHQVFMYAAAGMQVAKLILSVLLHGAADPRGVETLVTLHRVAMYAAPATFLVGSLIQVF